MSAADLFPISLGDQIACIERELNYRRRVYPRQVAARRMSQEQADKEIARMSAVRDTLMRVGNP